MKRVRNKRWLAGYCLIIVPYWLWHRDRILQKLQQHEFSIQQAVDYAKKNNVQCKKCTAGCKDAGAGKQGSNIKGLSAY